MAPISRTRRQGLADIFHNEVTAWVVLAVSLLITVLGSYIAAGYVERRASDRFLFEVEEARQRILKRMLDYEQVLRGGVALLDTLGRVPTRSEWHHYVETLKIQTYFPGIQGMGLSLMLTPDELDGHIAAVRAEGFPDYRVSPAGERKAYSAIVYLEPFDWRNQRAFGYDMYSNPMRRAAMQRARDTGAPAVSGKVTLVQETKEDVQAGFLVYLPAYRPGLPLATVEQRREALIGFVYSPFRMNDLMRGILGSDTPDVGFAIYDGAGETSEQTLLYESNPGDDWKRAAERHHTAVMQLPGRDWTVRFHSRPSFDAAMASSQPQLIAIGGVTVDLLLFAIIMSLAGQRRRVETRVEATTHELTTVANRLRLAQQSAAIGTWDYGLADDALIWDEPMFALYGVDPAHFSGRFEDWVRGVHPDDLAATRTAFDQAIAGERDFHVRFRVIRSDGQTRTLEGHGTVQRADDGRPLRVTGINRDITRRAQNEERLRLAATVFDHAHEGIAITDADERIIEINPTFTQMTGFSRADVIGQTPRVLKSGRQDAGFYTAMWRTLEAEGHWRGEIWNRRKDGSAYAEMLTISAVRDGRGAVTHYVGIFSDISVLKEQQHRLEQMAHYDALTHLPNRVLLADRMWQAMAQARRSGRLLAVCYLDLDGFKPVNDRYGHDVGDLLLIKVAERLTAHLRESDSAARLGGDEFVLLLNNLRDVAECRTAVERLLRAMAATYLVGEGHHIVVSASVGVTLYPDDDADTDALLRHADQAMYMAKQSGRNRYWLFDTEHDRRARARGEALGRIEAALARQEFRLHYQPRVDMRRGRTLGVEALIRWQHPERGLLPPAEFLPLIEETDLACRIGDWVLGEALHQLAQWQAQGLELVVGVNISGTHLQEPGFAQQLADLLHAHPGVRPEQVELEVLETTALEDTALVSRILGQCRALGVSVALDDFGTGYSSLTYLKRLPADALKIDQSFVRDMLSDPEDLTIIEGIIGLSQAFRRQVIAEGVETEAHGELLLRLGCDQAQGYGIARPMPAEEVPGWVRGYRQPAAWRASAKVYWLREDLPLLSAELEHRRWVEDLVATLEAGGDVVPPPQLDSHLCRFGQWYHGPGRTRYGTLAEYRQVGELHEAIHRLGNELLRDAEQGGALEQRLPQLLGLRDQVVGALHALQRAVSLRSRDSAATG